jgi:hypothetical protein
MSDFHFWSEYGVGWGVVRVSYPELIIGRQNLNFPVILNFILTFRLNGVLNKFDGDSVGICENSQRPRHIKSHLPIFMLPDQLWTVKPKVI